jgi:hypothetical protein
LNLGFLTILQENNGYLGGYLVTNQWGRPFGFWLTTAVQPNRVQQILYADTLVPYICGDLIGKTLVDKAALPVQAVFTESEAALDLRLKLEVPVAYLPQVERMEQPVLAGVTAAPTAVGVPFHPRDQLRTHAAFPGDAQLLQELLDRLHRSFDLTEPFQRIRLAMGEAKKSGVTSRN